MKGCHPLMFITTTSSRKLCKSLGLMLEAAVIIQYNLYMENICFSSESTLKAHGIGAKINGILTYCIFQINILITQKKIQLVCVIWKQIFKDPYCSYLKLILPQPMAIIL